MLDSTAVRLLLPKTGTATVGVPPGAIPRFSDGASDPPPLAARNPDGVRRFATLQPARGCRLVRQTGNRVHALPHARVMTAFAYAPRQVEGVSRPVRDIHVICIWYQSHHTLGDQGVHMAMIGSRVAGRVRPGFLLTGFAQDLALGGAGGAAAPGPRRGGAMAATPQACLALYFKALHECDAEAFRQMWHPLGHLLGLGPDGAVVDRDSEAFLASATSRDRSTDLAVHDRILALTLVDETCAAAKVQIALPPLPTSPTPTMVPTLYTDLVTMLCENGEWRIISKVHSRRKIVRHLFLAPKHVTQHACTAALLGDAATMSSTPMRPYASPQDPILCIPMLK